MDTTHEEHILSLINIANPENFYSTDFMAKDRIIVPKSKIFADDLIGKYIVVAGLHIKIKPYANPYKRVLFTHCFPHIEDDFLIGELEKCGVKTIDPITL